MELIHDAFIYDVVEHPGERKHGHRDRVMSRTKCHASHIHFLIDSNIIRGARRRTLHGRKGVPVSTAAVPCATHSAALGRG